MCKGIGYNETYMPNQFNHDNQEEAGLEVHQFWPLVEIQCSPDLQFFLCSLYTPICIQNYHKPLPACRSVCERAKAGCAPLMRQYGFSWPDKMNCENLPEYGDSENLCMDFNTSAVTTTTLPPVPTKPVKSIQNKQNIKPKASSEEDTDINQYLSFQPGSEIVSKMRRCSCRCNDPLLIGVNETSTYFNKVHTAGVPNCAIRCQDNYFTPDSHRFTMFWIGSWSILCCVSTILTVITFVLDRERFVYPERPIIILSACYFMVGLGYVIRIAFGRQAVGCSQQMIHYATTGPPLCTVVFLLTYFFGMAACIWWVILSLTWFLSAGLKWGQEAIASYSQYFHIVAWIVPSIKSIIILATASVDGTLYQGFAILATLTQLNSGYLYSYLCLYI
ncbi:FZD8 [Bugula neritina]|uniref:FZD8 n=1 Tax=Bugula neritina TaxID=10212 RepID=A0A7J7IVS2_BUGNE|nr:FZD8 [Bugula neritina]